jgi:hypothetical protein
MTRSMRARSSFSLPAGTRCLLDHAAKVAAIALGLNAKLASPQQLRELGDVDADAPGLVGGEQLGRRSASRLVHHRLCGAIAPGRIEHQREIVANRFAHRFAHLDVLERTLRRVNLVAFPAVGLEPGSFWISQPQKLAPKWAAPTPNQSATNRPRPKSHNHCAEVLVRFSSIISLWTRSETIRRLVELGLAAPKRRS